jgi:three-Cys-motif partner protein
VPGNFFDEPQLAAFLKHRILGGYLPVFAQKAGTSPGVRGDVHYIDGFAGPGLYDDDDRTPGSPMIAVACRRKVDVTASRSVITGHFVEKDRLHVEQLRALLDGEGLEDWPVYRGDVIDRLDEVMARIPDTAALFAFFDPFGLGLPLDLLDRLLFHRAGPTEILLNFSLPGLRRNAGHLDPVGSDPSYLKARAAIIAKLDTNLGGDWWQDIWRSEARHRERQVLRRYLEVLNQAGWSTWCVAAADRWEGAPSYYLIQLSRHRNGRWEFAQALSLALEHTRKRAADMAGQLDFDPSDEWAEMIARNIVGILGEKPSFVVDRELNAVHGETLGYAREKHIRSALRKLHSAGAITTDPKGQRIQTLRIARA